MAAGFLPLDDLTAEQRVELIGILWDSLDPAAAAPITDALEAELGRREAEADVDPPNGESWTEVKATLKQKLRERLP